MNISDFYMTTALYEPPFFLNREFAIIKRDLSMWRHLSFANVNKLRAFLIEHAPLHTYFSCAKYEYPELDMQAKKKYFLGADLVFDIDFDKLKVQTLNEAHRQTVKLKRILQKDFGFEDMMIVFSGKRGYHIHVRDACIQKCDNAARREIADYFCEFMPGKEKEKIENEKYIEIDTPVTCDVSRLIRLPGSLHGGSMKVCEIVQIDSFNRRANIFLKGRT